ncbi:MAG: hypothetical protein KF833_05705 [Verrucomicrobiae bacterium]|nr:hypothetical protein [Verrucomicrobiae bacterium]
MNPFPDRTRWVAWTFLALLALLWTVAASVWPRFPGDVPLTLGLQALTGPNPAWANALTNTARNPWFFLWVALSMAVAFRLAGWRGAASALVAFAILWSLDAVLKPVVARPRPTPDLIHVAGSARGFCYPSTFGVIYAGTFGFLGALAAVCAPRPWQWLLPGAAIVLLVLGASARIALGAHWPSDLAGSYLFGIVIVWPLVAFCRPKTGTPPP